MESAPTPTMTTERWRQIENLFHAARELPGAERAAFLAGACGGDAELCFEVGSLLVESDDPGDFLTESALSLGVSLLARGRVNTHHGSE